ncbi:MAG: RHS repeat-associated core domain-containing protein, partial [Flavobacteriaceae bacterium]|nr:RHS repeat-associated core domain-containing protein [Flavobacteriaceae bacterium]
YITNHESSSPGRTQVETKYDFEGKIEQTITKHKRTNAGEDTTIKDFYTYSDQGRLLTHTHQVNNKPVELLAENSYDELGQLIGKKVGNTSNSPLQNVDYRYNIRGWLKSINNVNDLGTDLFAFKLNYNEVEDETTQTQNQYIGKALYNGNIAETYWRTGSDNVKRKYGYHYDELNRLKNAVYQRPGGEKPVRNSYNESLTYDKNGNIKTLFRTGEYDDAIYDFEIDNLVYTYDTGNPNRLKKVDDSSSNPNGFNDITNETDYEYDDYGNMEIDRNKGITDIRYNHLNLPIKITFGTQGEIQYIYNAEGKKLEKFVKQGTTETTTKYLEGFQYVNNVLTFFPHAEGYVSKNGSNFNYVYHYTDHLGNIRLSYSKHLTTGVPTIMEENNYYPFGLKHKNYNMTHLEYFEEGGNMTLDACVNCNYKYKFNSMEYQDELGLNMYDMDARQYDPAIGRWVVNDPIVHFDASPYSAFNNNPVYWVDPSGMSGEHYDWDKGKYLNDKGEEVSFETAMASQGLNTDGSEQSNGNDDTTTSEYGANPMSTDIHPKNKKEYEKKYPTTTKLLKHIYEYVKMYPSVLETLAEYSGYSTMEVLEQLQYGKGDMILSFESLKWHKLNPEGITLSATDIRAHVGWVNALEKAKTNHELQRVSFFLAVTILHEFVHAGRKANKMDKGGEKQEMGWGWELRLFGKAINYDNAGTEYKKYEWNFKK